MTRSLHELLQGARAGDAGARDELLRAIYPQVERQVHAALARDFRRRHPWTMALFSTGDIVQEVFLAVVRCEPEAGAQEERQLWAWLATQVQNRIIDRVRFHLAQRRNARQTLPLAEGQTDGPSLAGRDRTPSVIAALDERAALVERVLDELDAGERKLWQARVEDERSFADVARDLGYPSDESARSAFRRLQARLAVRLHRLGVRGVEGASEP